MRDIKYIIHRAMDPFLFYYSLVPAKGNIKLVNPLYNLAYKAVIIFKWKDQFLEYSGYHYMPHSYKTEEQTCSS
jgi:hypothetical protein